MSIIMQNPFVPLICALGTFVLISDYQRPVAATELQPFDKRVIRQTKDTKYTTKYDTFNVDEILRSNRLLKNYIRCLLDEGPCTSEGTILKEHIPDALQSDCSKCSEVQKTQAGKVMSHILQYHRKEWDRLLLKYDPEGHFRKQHGYGEDYNEDEDEDKQ